MSTPEFYAILTDAAMQLQFECLDSNKRFEMLEIAVGDGNGSYYEPEKTQTKLKNECYRASISRRLTDENGLVKSVILDIPEDVTGFTVREVGVFGADGALLIIGKYPEYTRHSNDSGAITQQAIKVDLAQINELVLPILIDPSVNTASVQYVDDKFQNIKEIIDNCGSGMPIGNIYHLNCTKYYVPEGSLPTDGTEYTKAQFTYLWNNYLTSEETEIVPTGVDLLGSFNNENGIVSGTGQISYSLLPEIWNGEDCELVYKFIADDITTTQKIFNFISGYWISIIDGVIGAQLEGSDHFIENSSLGYYTTPLTSNEFYIKLSFSNSWSISVSMNNSDWATLVDAETWSAYTTPPINIGTSGKYLGQVDLTQSCWVNLETNKTIQFTTERQKSLLNTCTYDEYASDLATYGKCNKFAVDTTNETFKVPIIPDGAVIQQALSDSELGKVYNAGVPNLYGQFGTGQNDYFDGVLFTQGENINDDANAGGSSDTSAIFDASKYNPIYGNSDTVQMNAVALRYFVVVAKGSINQSQMDWSEWASNLQAKANKDGTNWEASVRNIDGQWVSSISLLSSITTAGTYTVDLSDYLPKDNSNYEIMINYWYAKTAEGHVDIYSDILKQSSFHPINITAEVTWHSGRMIIPISTARKLYIYISANMTTSTKGVEAVAYRRIGTNQ